MTQQAGDALGMSLDDIIIKQKAAKKASRGGANKPKGRAAPYPTAGKPKASALASASDKLVVSNLAPSVSQSDVKELFSRIGIDFFNSLINKIGPVRSAQLNFNEHGKSKGVANVIFVKAGDAHKAYQEYHNRPLDNKPMKIELIINPESAKLKQLDSRLGSGSSQGVGKSHGSGRRGGRGGSRGGRNNNNRAPKKDVTAMDLDAEMDAYMAADAAPAVSLADALG